MATKTYFINSPEATYNDDEFAWFQSLFLNEGVVGAPGTGLMGLEVTEKTPTPDMSVNVSAGKVLVEITRGGRTFKVVVESDAVANIVIAANSSGSNRVDAIIVRVDKDATPNALKTNVSTIEVVQGSGTSPLTDGAISTAVGNDGWFRLANVTVPNATSDIEDTDIASTRTKVSFIDGLGLSGIFTALTGVVLPYAGATAPTGFLLCDGEEYDRDDYADLFAIIGETFGPGDGVDTFNVPDMRARFPVGVSDVDSRTVAFTTADIDATQGNDWIETDTPHFLVTGDRVRFSTDGTLPVTKYPEAGYNVDVSGNITGGYAGSLRVGQKVYITGQSSSNFGTGVYYVRSQTGSAITLSTSKGGTTAGTGNAGSINFFAYGLNADEDFFLEVVDNFKFRVRTTRADAVNGTGEVISFATSDPGIGNHEVHVNIGIRTLGERGGESDHQLTIPEMPSHVHGSGMPNGTSSFGSSSDSYSQGNTDPAGGDQSHNNMPPYVALNYIIKI